MKLAIALQVSPHSGVDMETVWEAERLGFAAAWCGEAYGTDAVSPVAWVLAQTKRIKAGTSIMQMPARTPACAAMTAMTLQLLSGNRFPPPQSGSGRNLLFHRQPARPWFIIAVVADRRVARGGAAGAHPGALPYRRLGRASGPHPLFMDFTQW